MLSLAEQKRQQCSNKADEGQHQGASKISQPIQTILQLGRLLLENGHPGGEKGQPVHFRSDRDNTILEDVDNAGQFSIFSVFVFPAIVSCSPGRHLCSVHPDTDESEPGASRPKDVPGECSLLWHLSSLRVRNRCALLLGG